MVARRNVRGRLTTISPKSVSALICLIRLPPHSLSPQGAGRIQSLRAFRRVRLREERENEGKTSLVIFEFWCMIGGAVQASAIDNAPLPFVHFLPLISSIVGFLMTALVDGELFDERNEGVWKNPNSPGIGMGIVVAGLFLCAVGLSTSIVVLVTAFEEKKDPEFDPPNDLPGVLNVASNSIIFVSAWYYRMSHWPGACGDDDDYDSF